MAIGLLSRNVDPNDVITCTSIPRYLHVVEYHYVRNTYDLAVPAVANLSLPGVR